MTIRPLQAAIAFVFACTALGASAQTPSTGEADTSGSRAAPSAPVSPAEKSKARKARRTEGALAARTEPIGDDDPHSVGKARSSSKEERKAARAARRKETAGSLRRGDIQSGEQ
ncbi:MAG: hypothetical protein ACXWC6_03555 [Ramlibacter sp.]